MTIDQHATPWVVAKFGGTSVANGESWSKIAQILEQHLQAQRQVFMVCSAPSGVSNLLESLLSSISQQQTTEILEDIQGKYQGLLDVLDVDCEAYVQTAFRELTGLIDDIQRLGEVTANMHAQVMAFGELLLTRIGVEYLQKRQIDVMWQDARDWLTAVEHLDSGHPDAYLNAQCNADSDPLLQQKLRALNKAVVVTQGFIARNARGETVLLGRGGSDTSAAYFASKLVALRCEIWTDVPGIYTANPRQVPQARMIKHLDYDEAQEIASMGAEVLHPQCIFPVSISHIPIHVRYTLQPQRVGTEIYTHKAARRSQIKSISIKHDIVLVIIETLKMWQQVGFLADIFQCFKHHGMSIDLISTSESTVTVSLDANKHSQEQHILDALLKDLNQFARASVISPCASVSLVGRNIRAILHQLGEVFTVFEEQQVYLLSQAANDLNLTVVVDEDQSLRLASKLHHLLIEQKPMGDPFHLSWAEEFGEPPAEKQVAWWQQDSQRLLQLAAEETVPQYVYSAAMLEQSVAGLLSCDAVNQFFYSIKANNNVDILKKFYVDGLSFESVSIEELQYLLKLFPKIARQRLLFTPNFAAKSEYEYALSLGVHITIDSLYPLQHWANIFSGHEVLIRVDIGKGSGHHKYVVTGGDQSKFGIPLCDLNEVKSLVEQHQINVVGLHSHAGSGILDPQHWQHVFTSLANLLPLFPAVKVINVGGGLGIVERPGQHPLNLSELNASLHAVRSAYPDIRLWMEPGRYLVAEAGVLLAKITQIKGKADRQFVGVDTGMNSLIRPALYGSYHDIVNLTRLDQPKIVSANIVGPICESGDTLGYSRWLPESQEGDVILIANVGAYGHTMSSHYNLRLPAVEYYLGHD